MSGEVNGEKSWKIRRGKVEGKVDGMPSERPLEPREENASGAKMCPW